MGKWGTGSWGTGQWGSNPADVPPPKLAGVGNWGVSTWGCATWGGASSPEPSPPSLGALDPGAICDVKGGTVLGIFGDNFVDPTRIFVVDPIGLEVLGEAYYFEAKIDLRKNKILAGFPALPAGTYGVKISTPAGMTPVLLDAVTYLPFAEEGKVQRVRRRWGEFWATGERLLT
jgi:hypothetical protein